MSLTIERTLRRQTDPDDVLPRLRLRVMKSLCESDYESFKILKDLAPVGSVMLHRWNEHTGRPVARIESLRIDTGTNSMPERYAATLAILAMSTQEGRTLVSDTHGSTTEEVAVWYWLTGEGLATIDTEFKPRPQLFLGNAIYDGTAYAPPVTLRG